MKSLYSSSDIVIQLQMSLKPISRWAKQLKKGGVQSHQLQNLSQVQQAVDQPPNPYSERLKTQVKTIKTQLARPTLDQQLFKKATEIIPIEKTKGVKRTFTKQLAHRKRLEYVEQAKTSMEYQLDKSRKQLKKEIQEQRTQAQKVMEFQELFSNMVITDDQQFELQKRLDRKAKKKAEQILSEIKANQPKVLPIW